ncbi:MAG: hypothetical protein H7066_08300, partial [Cytophagaceae bacterium]|nr:hypothetical protein [Gemmatimonadaceae bacterium]
MTTLAAIEREVRAMAAHIRADADLLPTFGRTRDSAYPHIEVNEAGMHWVVVERGQELERATFQDLGGLLERVLNSITFSMALAWELRHRRAGQDNRRLMFARQLELLRDLSPLWAEREMVAQAETLARHPYDDASEARVRLTTRLRRAGQSDEEAWRNACA